MILQELGYQAGQHELLADTYGKDCSKSIDERLKEVKKEIEKNKKEAEMIEKNLSQSYKAFDNKKSKYEKAHMDLQVTLNTFKKTESDGTISRNVYSWIVCRSGLLYNVCMNSLQIWVNGFSADMDPDTVYKISW